MIITDKDNELFKALNASHLGGAMTNFLERLMAHVCDARSNAYPDDVRRAAADVIQREIVDRIQLRNENAGGKAGTESFE